MSKKYQITADLFTLPYKEDSAILYAPRVGFACAANVDLINLLADLEMQDFDSLNDEQIAALDYLDQKGLVNGSPEVSVIPIFPEKFSPTELTLFPTNQCNLRCRYCYASAGDWKPKVMDWHYAVSAIECVIENLKQRNMQTLSLGFHGGGEPLYPWEFIKRTITYAEERCAQEGLQLMAFSATNGVLSQRQLEWIVKHFVNLNISFDGLPEAQNYHRPLISGKGSFEFVDRTLRFLDERQFNYGIRGTISSFNVDRMEDIIDFIGQNYQVKMVHLEPIFYCGRCKTNNILSPEMQKFADNFRNCEQKALAYNIALTYSGCHLEHLRGSFCGVATDSFSITPDGDITGCYEITSNDDPKSETFFIGRIQEDGRLEIDEKKRAYLHSLTVDNLEFCRDCFAKWHCAGECAAKLDHTDYTGARGNERCVLNRDLIRSRLINLIEGKPYRPNFESNGTGQKTADNKTC
ncbi:MAG: radical SAM protein [bacterium]